MADRVVVYLEEGLLRPVDEVARRQRWSRSKTISWLVEKRLEDKYGDLLTSPSAAPSPPSAKATPSTPAGQGGEPPRPEPRKPPAAADDSPSPWERLARNAGS